MFYFILAGLAGLLLNTLVDVFFRKNSWASQIGTAVIGGLLVVLLSWFFHRSNLGGTLGYAVVFAAGFAIPYGVSWLGKRLGR